MVVAKKFVTAAALMAGIALLGGCDKLQQEKWEPQEPGAISISEEGIITETIQETLDQSYYDAAELKNMIDSEVADYNGKNGENSVTVKTYEAAEGAVTLVMEYASAGDYAKFNNVEFYYGSMIDAQLEGYLFDVSFKRVNDGVIQGSAVTGEEVIKHMADQVLIVRAPLEVQVPGEVHFTSTNAEVRAADVVNATGEQEEEEDEGLVLPSNAIYKEEQADATLAEEAAANRVYIIFEEN